jgi:hypothetical protein
MHAFSWLLFLFKDSVCKSKMNLKWPLGNLRRFNDNAALHTMLQNLFNKKKKTSKQICID